MVAAHLAQLHLAAVSLPCNGNNQRSELKLYYEVVLLDSTTNVQNKLCKVLPLMASAHLALLHLAIIVAYPEITT
jgi:hypothetical protein